MRRGVVVKALVILAVGSLLHPNGAHPQFNLGDVLGGLGGGGLGGRVGSEPLCPGKQVPAPTEGPYQLRANGCGPEGMQVNEDFGLFTCCNGHDICFSMCGTTHAYCERTFKTCMKKVCKTHSGSRSQECMQQANSFSSMTAAFGGGFHASTQKEVCQCYKDEDAAQKRHHKVIMAIYQKYDAPKATEEKVNALLQKYRGKEGEAYFKLTKKYRKSEIFWDNIQPEFEWPIAQRKSKTEL